MKAVFIREPGDPDVLELRDAPTPVPADGQILIGVKAAGINRPDIAQRRGTYPVPADASPIPGLEVAGVVVGTGGNTDGFKEGDAVFALTHGGGYATHCVVDAAHAFRLPANLSFVEAAALPEVAFTIEFNLFMRASLASSETVLIHGGSSGIGAHATARAKCAGATVITTAGDSRKCEFSRAQGADHALNYRETDWVEEILKLTNGRGVDVVLDMVGGDYVDRNIRCLADDGRYALISLQGGKRTSIDLESILRRRLSLIGSTLRPLSHARKARIADRIRDNVLPLIAEGKLSPPIYRTFPITAVHEAHRLMESGDHLGKIVIEVGEA